MLDICNLVAGYGKVQVLHGISLSVRDNSLVTLIGANGAGKTTAMRAISGLLQPSSGTIRLNGADTTDWPASRVACAGLAHSPEGRRVFASLSVIDNLRLGAFTRLTGRRERGDVAQDLERMLTLFPKLAERRTQLAGTLSGGEQQMLAIARALMLNPVLLLLDEPSMGLAPKLVEEVFTIIRALRAQKLALLLVEQFAAAALEIADYAYVMENGRLVHEGPATRVKNDPAVRAAYLGGH